MMNNNKITAMPLQRSHRRLTRQDKLLQFLGDTLLIVLFVGGCFAAYWLLSLVTGW